MNSYGVGPFEITPDTCGGCADGRLDPVSFAFFVVVGLVLTLIVAREAFEQVKDWWEERNGK